MRWLVILGIFSHSAFATPLCESSLHDDVAFLASKQLDGRAPGTDGSEQAMTFIENRFSCLGLTPGGDVGGYREAFTTDGKATANIIGLIPGTDLASEIVIVSAHHDHLGDGHLGANDDASGIAALLAIAQEMSHGDPPKRTIVFAAFGAEEAGMIGSNFFAKELAATLPIGNVVQFIELDMVGTHNSDDLVAAMGAFRGFGARTLLDKRLKEFPKLHVSAGGKARGSDFQPFCEMGVPYTFFWTPDHRCYHERCDTIDHLDMPHMIDIVKLAGELVRDLGDTNLDLLKLRATKGCGVKISGASS